jgi:hypothetical protein
MVSVKKLKDEVKKLNHLEDEVRKLNYLEDEVKKLNHLEDEKGLPKDLAKIKIIGSIFYLEINF